jgi:DNA invertase Pin-like site-specific DNA recombinase
MKTRKFITNYTNEEIDEIVSLYLSGISLTSISNKLNVVRRTIKKILLLNNVWIENRDNVKINFSNKEIDKIKEMYLNENFSTEKIGCYFNVSKIPIIKILKNLDILRKGYSNGIKINLTEEKKEKIENLYLNKYKSAEEIGKELNLTASFINKHLTTVNYRRTVSEGVSIGLVKRTGIEYDKYLKNLPEYKKYRLFVVKLTNRQPINLLENYNKRGVSGIDGAYCLDHKYSIFEGFKNGIKPEIIASLKNLVFIPWRENVIKRTKCSITKEELINI